jgi:hypothetical protein
MQNAFCVCNMVKHALKNSINASYVCISQIVAHECGNGYFVQFGNITIFEE